MELGLVLAGSLGLGISNLGWSLAMSFKLLLQDWAALSLEFERPHCWMKGGLDLQAHNLL
jgi:hypothetical protein